MKLEMYKRLKLESLTINFNFDLSPAPTDPTIFPIILDPIHSRYPFMPYPVSGQRKYAQIYRGMEKAQAVKGTRQASQMQSDCSVIV